MNELSEQYSIQSYLEKNREKIDESMVSLRLMKEVDKFLDCMKLSNKDVAKQLGYSESYISQLMSGVKKVNTSFICKLEKSYKVKFDFKLYSEINQMHYRPIHENKMWNFELNLNSFSIHTEQSFVSRQTNRSMQDITDIQFETL